MMVHATCASRTSSTQPTRLNIMSGERYDSMNSDASSLLVSPTSSSMVGVIVVSNLTKQYTSTSATAYAATYMTRFAHRPTLRGMSHSRSVSRHTSTSSSSGASA